jgi:hypothetical protein
MLSAEAGRFDVFDPHMFPYSIRNHAHTERYDRILSVCLWYPIGRPQSPAPKTRHVEVFQQAFKG